MGLLGALTLWNLLLPPSSVDDRCATNSLVLPVLAADVDARMMVAAGRGTVSSVGVSIDVGLLPRVQAGVLAAVSVYPEGDLTAAIANIGYAFAEGASLRADVGAERSFVGADASMTFTAGVGLPIRIPLSDSILLWSGAPSVRDYTLGPVGGATYTSTDLFTYSRVQMRAPFGGIVERDFVALGLPVGFTFLPTRWLAIDLHGGIRVGLADANFTNFPIGGSLSFTLGRWTFTTTLDAPGNDVEVLSAGARLRF